MEEIKKKERCIRSFCMSHQASEESSVPEEEETIIAHLRDSQLLANSSDCPSRMSSEERDAYYFRKYPSFKKLEEACKQIEKEKALEAKKSLLARKRLNFSSQKLNSSYNSSESLLSNSATVAASDSGYDPDDSMSTTLHKIHSVLDSYINESYTNSSSHVNSLQDSLLHEESFATSGTSYMELKEMLNELSFSKQHRNESDLYLRRLSNLVDRLPRDCVTKLRTILEEFDDEHNLSLVLFKKEVLKVTNKNLSIQKQMITYTILNSSSKETSSETPATSSTEQTSKTSCSQILFDDSTRSRNVSSSRTPVTVKLAEHKNFSSSSSPSVTPESAYMTEDLNESSFTINEKLCLGNDIPKTPKPMRELTDKEKQALEHILEQSRKQELKLASESPCRPASGSSGSLSDWKIRDEVAKRDKTLTERGTEKNKENKVEKSYADEFWEKVQKHFAESDRSKNLSGLNDTSVEVTSIHRNKLYSSSSWINSRKRASPLRKVTGGFIKRKSLIPRYKGVSNNKSAVMSTSKVSCMLDMIYSMSDASKKAGSSTSASTSSDSTATPGKSASPLLSSGWTAGAKKSANKFDSAHSDRFEVPVIIITANTPEIRRKINYSPYESSEAKGQKFVGRYFRTPGRTPVPKKKRVFFPTPNKNRTPKPRAKSPVGAYIRGDLSASLISSPYRVRNEFLKKDEDF